MSTDSNAEAMDSNEEHEHGKAEIRTAEAKHRSALLSEGNASRSMAMELPCIAKKEAAGRLGTRSAAEGNV